MSALATGTADALNNPAAKRDDSEFPCPEKRFEIIAAERCVQNTACPRAAACELRTIAIKLTRKARAPETAPKRRFDTGTKRRWKKACAMCPRDSLRGQTVCSDRCRDELAVYQASTRGGPGSHEAKTALRVAMLARPHRKFALLDEVCERRRLAKMKAKGIKKCAS